MPRLSNEEIDAFQRMTDEEHAAWLDEHYRRHVIDRLRAMDSLTALIDHADKVSRDDPVLRCPERELLFRAAMGDFDRVREIATENRHKWVGGLKDFPANQALLSCARVVDRLVASGDLGTLAEVMHGWEASMAIAYNVTEFHERTPFPFETS